MSIAGQLSRAFRNLFGSGDFSSNAIFARLGSRTAAAEKLVQMFYLVVLLRAAQLKASTHAIAVTRPEFGDVWPLAWAADLPQLIVADVLTLSLLAAAFFAFLSPRLLIWRLGVPLFLLPVMAVPASLGAVHHGDHMMFWIAVVFVFLPNSTETRLGKLNYCLTFAGAQGLILSFYTLAGFWKTASGLRAIVEGEAGNFAPSGLAATLADRTLQTGTEPLLAHVMIENIWLSWPLFLGLIYLQLVAVAIAFRPSLHAIWGIVFVGFHIGTFVLMEIAFPMHIVFAALMLVCSPFLDGRRLELSALGHLPIFGGIVRKFAPRPSPKRSDVAWQS